MKTKTELAADVARLMRQIRKDAGLSKARMAELMEIDDHTLSKYESGQSVPSVVDFAFIFPLLGKDALRAVLDILYPDTYDSEKNDTYSARAELSHFISVLAPDLIVRELSFLLYGEHGSSFYPQMQEYTMLDHLPMEARILVAQQVYSLWQMNEARGALRHTDAVMPDVDAFVLGMQKGLDAVLNKREAYSMLGGVKHGKG